MEWIQLALLVLGAYLLGAIPTGLIIGLRMGKDLRQFGSGKTGATNALRVIGGRAAAAVFLLDAAKGALPVLVARLLPWPDAIWFNIALGSCVIAAIAGHIWSLWIRLFTGAWGGGRGVATVLGSTLMVHPLAALAGLGAAVLVMVLTRYVSLGSITGVAVGLAMICILVLLQQISAWFLPWGVASGALVVLMHHDNIRRLLKGTERKLGQRS